MTREESEEAIEDEIAARSCGTCHVCCIWLGVDAPADGDRVALRKWPGQTCRNCNAHPDPNAKCQVYANRPHACETYKCGWRIGFGRRDGRPDQSGLLLSLYPPMPDSDSPCATITITDITKCGVLSDASGHLRTNIEHLIEHGVSDIRIMSHASKAIIHFFNGEIFHGRLLKAEGPEQLSFETYLPPLGRYELRDGKMEDLKL